MLTLPHTRDYHLHLITRHGTWVFATNTDGRLRVEEGKEGCMDRCTSSTARTHDVVRTTRLAFAKANKATGCHKIVEKRIVRVNFDFGTLEWP